MLILRHKSGDIGYTFWCIPEVYFILSIYLNTTERLSLSLYFLCRAEEAHQPFFGEGPFTLHFSAEPSPMTEGWASAERWRGCSLSEMLSTGNYCALSHCFLMFGVVANLSFNVDLWFGILWQ